jgi:Protein of unknown function (DUF742)
VSAEDDPRPMIGYTGARFGGASRRKTRKRSAATEVADQTNPRPGDPRRDIKIIPTIPASAAAPRAESITATPGGADAAAGPVVGHTGARFAPRPRRKPAPPTEPAEQVPAHGSTPPPPPSPLPPEPASGEPVDAAGSSFVRPYVFTRGRTRPQFELPVEALVSAVRHDAARSAMGGEHEAVVALCREPRSVAELAALLSVPLGVARVLVGDLATAGAVAVHRTAGGAGPDHALMARVLSGLRRL